MDESKDINVKKKGEERCGTRLYACITLDDEGAEGEDCNSEWEEVTGLELRWLARAEFRDATALPTVVDGGLRFRTVSAVKPLREPKRAVETLYS